MSKILFIVSLFALTIPLYSQNILIKDCDKNISISQDQNPQCDEWQIDYDGTRKGLITGKSLAECIMEMEYQIRFNTAYNKYFPNDQIIISFSAPICKQCNKKTTNDLGKSNTDRITYAKMIFKKAMDKTLPKMEDIAALIDQNPEENPFSTVGNVLNEYKDNLLDAANKLKELRSKLEPIDGAVNDIFDEVSKMQSELQTQLINVDKTYARLDEEIKYAINNKKYNLKQNKEEKDKKLAEEKRIADEKIAANQKQEEERLIKKQKDDEEKLAQKQKQEEEKGKVIEKKKEIDNVVTKDGSDNNLYCYVTVTAYQTRKSDNETPKGIRIVTNMFNYNKSEQDKIVSKVAEQFQSKINEINIPQDYFFEFNPYFTDFCQIPSVSKGRSFEIIKAIICQEITAWSISKDDTETLERRKNDRQMIITFKDKFFPVYTLDFSN